MSSSLPEALPVSVVTAVFNGGPSLAASIQSVLDQTLQDFELIVVDDGSEDESPELLDQVAGDDCRMKVFHHPHRGLTLSLIDGCAAARGRFIARHDAGDISLPQRLERQLALAESEPEVALVSCHTRFVDPEGEELYTVRQESRDASATLQTLEPDDLHGPSHHGATFFPRALYKSVGGYREAFAVGQDLDLWVRLAERGRHIVVPEVLYEASLSPESISGLLRPEQMRAKQATLASARARRAGESDASALEQLRSASVQPTDLPSLRQRRASALYFLGNSIRSRNPAKARDYYRRALRENPFHLRAWARLSASWLR